MKIDTIIKNGRVLDPADNIDEVRDIGIDSGMIVKIREGDEAVQTIDAEGSYVLPGLIDFHIHAFGAGSGWGIAEPDLLLSTGVTSAVDAGSAGCTNYNALHNLVVNSSMVRMKTMLNVYNGGTLDMQFDEILDPDRFHIKMIRKTIMEYGNEIIAIKIRFAKSIAGDYGLAALDRAVDIAEELELPLCVHITDPPCTQSDIAKRLRKGDIMCHIFHGRGETILDSDGNIQEDILKAKERGVLFDVAHGNTNFSFRVIREALREEFKPDVISTDMCRDKLNISVKTKSLVQVMSLYLNMGLQLKEVVKAVTEVPAGLMGMTGKIGTLREGAYGDVAIVKLKDMEYLTEDYEREVFVNRQMFIPQMTIVGGEIAFCQQDFNLRREG